MHSIGPHVCVAANLGAFFIKIEVEHMRWFKGLSKNHPIFEAIYNDFGYEGYGLACELIAEATNQDTWEINLDRVKNWLGLRVNKATKLLPYFQKLIKDYQINILNYHDNNPNYSDNNPNYQINNPITDASNPRGSIKEERLDKIERVDRKREKPENFPTEVKDVITKPLSLARFKNYFINSKNPNMHNISWLEGFINQSITEIRQVRQDLTDDDMYSCWCETCDKASAKGVSSPKWYKTTFIGVMGTYNREAQQVKPSHKQTVYEQIKLAGAMRNIFTGEVYEVGMLKFSDSNKIIILPDGRNVTTAEYEPVEVA